MICSIFFKNAFVEKIKYIILKSITSYWECTIENNKSHDFSENLTVFVIFLRKVKESF